VEAAEKDRASILHTVKELLRVRHAEADLHAAPNFEVLFAEKGAVPFVYKRGSLVLAVNPSGAVARAKVPVTGTGKPVFAIGTGSALENGTCTVGAQSFGIWRI
jgi:maltose alpha-D-glucosyltransferase/alpha-amylase